MQHPEGATVHIAWHDDLVAGLEVRREHRVFGGETRAKHRGARHALEVRQHGFQALPRRIRRPGVVEATMLPRPDLLIGRRLKDRRNDGAGFRLAGLPGVNGAGREIHDGLLGGSGVRTSQESKAGKAPTSKPRVRASVTARCRSRHDTAPVRPATTCSARADLAIGNSSVESARQSSARTRPSAFTRRNHGPSGGRLMSPTRRAATGLRAGVASMASTMSSMIVAAVALGPAPGP